MLDAISISLGGIAGVESDTSTSKQSLAETYSQFLTLLTTQLKHQDPLDPMDSKDMTNQMIQLSNTEQQIAQTDRMNEILKINQASAVNSALGYIGKEVDYVGGETEFKGNPVNVKYYLDGDAQAVKISVLDKDGKVVRTMDGNLKAGGHSIVWDGKNTAGELVAQGDYKIEVGAQDKEGKAVQTTTIVPSTVDGIETAGGQLLLVIGNQKVAIGAVQAVRDKTATAVVTPPTTETPDTETPTT